MSVSYSEIMELANVQLEHEVRRLTDEIDNLKQLVREASGEQLDEQLDDFIEACPQDESFDRPWVALLFDCWAYLSIDEKRTLMDKVYVRTTLKEGMRNERNTST